MQYDDHDKIEGGFSRIFAHASWSVVQILDAYAVWIAVGVSGALFCAIAARNSESPVVVEQPASETTAPVVNRGPSLVEAGQKFFDAGDFPTAVSCYSDIISSQSSQAEVLPALINRAVAQTRLNKFTKALDDLSRANQLIAAFPEFNNWNYDVELRVAQTKCLAGDHEAATVLLNQLAAAPRDPQTVYTLRATALSQKQDYHGVIRDLSRILNVAPNAAAYINRATAFHTLQNYPLALADTQRASELLAVSEDNPQDPNLKNLAAVNHCLSLHAAGMYGEAISITTELLSDEIAASEMHMIRASAMRMLGHVDEALIDEQLARKLDAKDSNATTNKSSTIATNTTEQSSTNASAPEFPKSQTYDGGIFTIALQTVADSPTEFPEEGVLQIDGLIDAAMARVADNDPGEAVAMLERHLSFFPKDEDARIRRVAILLDMNDLGEAERDLDFLMESKDQSVTVHSLRGLAFSRQGNLDAAIDAFSSSVRLSENEPLGYFNRGTVYFSKENWQLAANDFRRAVKCGDESSTTFSWLGRALAKSDQFEEAMDCHDRAIAAGPTSAAFKFRGMTCSEFGKSEKALADFTAALATSPNDTKVLGMRTQLLLESGRYEEALDDAKTLASLQRGDQVAINLVQRLEAQIDQNPRKRNRR